MLRYAPFTLAVVLLLVLSAATCAQTKRALLIGIDTYQSKSVARAAIKFKDTDGPSRWSTQEWPNLKGAVNDVKAMKALLTSPKFGFSAKEPYMHLLLDEEAKRDQILADMKKYLVDLPNPGDVVVFYYSGHGSLRVNSLSKKELKQGNLPLDNTIVPADASTAVFDVRDREIARIFNAALDKGVILTAIFDSCHSGTIARGVPIGTATRARFLPYDPRDIKEAPDTKDGKEVTAPADRTDNAALIMSAALANQLAIELDFANGSYGAFTVALIGALEALPADIPAKDLFKRVIVVLKSMGVVDQEPTLDGIEQRRQQPLFGKGSPTGKLRVASDGEDGDGIALNSGYSDHLGVGSELVRINNPKDSESLRIKIKSVDGLALSHATIVSPANATVEAGDVFELDKWVPSEKSLLPIWLPPGNLTQQQLQELAPEIQLLKSNPTLTWVDDPARQTPTHLISWDGRQWLLTSSEARLSQFLGATLRADSVVTKLRNQNAKLFVNLPPSTELIKQLDFNRPDVPIKILTEPQGALYTLVGTYDGRHLSYSWFRRTALEEKATLPPGSVTECAVDSPYPIRSDWISVSQTDKQNAGQILADLAVRLDKVYAWLNLPTPPLGDPVSAFPYHLALKRKSDQKYLSDSRVIEGDTLDLLLKSDEPISPQVVPRWVYVMAIDCSGKGRLLFPRGGIENKYPREGASDMEISVLGKGHLIITPPFGTETYILLTTNKQLPDPASLNFEGVVKTGVRGNSPLQDLLSNASRGTRGPTSPMPTEWGVQVLQLTSSPKQ